MQKNIYLWYSINMYVRAKIHTDQKKEKMVVLDTDVFEIYIKEKPEQNRANLRVREILANHLSVPTTAVSITAGHQRPNKTFFIRQDTAE
jgi:uncharacterized protein YggU (UPF0235/DUF167 family)